VRYNNGKNVTGVNVDATEATHTQCPGISAWETH